MDITAATIADLAVSAFRPCATFEADHHDAAGPCRWCGWLDVDHDEPTAAVHVLPGRVALEGVRLAS